VAAQKIVKRDRINLSLFLLVLLLSAFIWWSKPEQTESQFTSLTELLPEQIESIQISNRSGPAFHIQRDKEHWRMTEPYNVAANRIRVERLLDILTVPVYTQFAIEQHKLTEFGLQPPLVLLQLDQLEIRVGGTDPINHYRYLAIADRLYLIKDQFPHLLLATAESFVAQNILPSESQLELIQTPEWQLARTTDQTQVWQLTPVVPGISMDRLIEKVDAWSNALALNVVKAPAQEMDSRVNIRLRGSAGPLSFGILREQQESYLIREDLGLAYQLPNIDALLAAPTGAE